MSFDPIIHVYVVCKNEVEFIPFFLDYYNSIADRIIVYDNQSTDGTRELIQQHPKAELRDYDTKGQLRDDIHRYIKNSVWVESRGVADWVIVSDLDELLYHKDLKRYLNSCKKNGITIPKVKGFNMVSETYPVAGKSIVEQVQYGAFSKNFSKSIVFDPNKIQFINFSPGGHGIEPEGEIHQELVSNLILLHYKYLGSPERLSVRWDGVGKELSPINIEKRWGIERCENSILVKRHAYVKKHAERVIYKRTLKNWFIKMWDYIKRDRNPMI